MLHGRCLAHGSAGSSRARRHRADVLGNAAIWQQLDLSQELGVGDDSYGHDGCVNALCWSDDGGCLLSGSDDRRICMWTPDADSIASHDTPHPFKLSEVIHTGHRANIFSTKFLPHATHPTIVSCAGDSQIRVYDVERLDRVNVQQRQELDGDTGPGVRVLRCHTDRAKRISVEDNPNVFLSVSEDGTVRQHDLRTSHACRTGCPTPLLEALGDISLYTLSVSPLHPYLFTVAGTAPYAYLQDRRMVRVARNEWAVPGWKWRDQEAKVQCVRRFGLRPEVPPEQGREGSEEGGETRAQSRRMAARARVRRARAMRHITAVEMSKDNAEELIVSFSGHSVALYSIYDSPPETSARASSSSMLPASPKPPKRQRTRSPDAGQSPASGEQRHTPSSSVMGTNSAVQGEREHPQHQESLNPETGSEAGPIDAGLSTPRKASQGSEEGGIDDNDDGVDPDDRMSAGEGSGDSATSNPEAGRTFSAHDLLRDETGESDDASSDDDDAEDDEVAWMEQEEAGLYPETDADELFNKVPYVYQRQNYRGAKNVHTVKDVTFLGVRSDKVCSGSDDGNWFVWDKATGRLDGIWKGDDQVVNVVEQHPNLPLVAVSGIDSTVKIFSPQSDARMPSWRRIDQAEQIIRDNAAEVPDRMPGVVSRSAMLQYYLRTLAAQEEAGIEIDGPEGRMSVADCRTQ